MMVSAVTLDRPDVVKRRCAVASAFVSLCLAVGEGPRAAWATAPPPATVSPGRVTEVALIADRCPTFNWGGVEGAAAYELVVFRLPGDVLAEPLQGSPPVIQITLPGATNGWTPSLDQCLEVGGQYAWSLRMVSENAVTDWSQPSLFAVAEGPDEKSFREELAGMREYLGRSGAVVQTGALGTIDGGSGPFDDGEGGREMASSSEDAPVALALATPDKTGIRSEAASTGIAFGVHGISNSTGNGSAGVVGQSTATSGQTFGVIGDVASADGIAAAFDNAAGGKILSGLSGGVEVFSVAGDGTITGDGSGLANGDAETLDGLDSTDFPVLPACGLVGQALTCDPNDNLLWDYPIAVHLLLPYSESISDLADAFSVTNSFGGTAITAEAAGVTGSAAVFALGNTPGGPAFEGVATGAGAGAFLESVSGPALDATITAAANLSSAILATSSGSGSVISASDAPPAPAPLGTGRAGFFNITNPANGSTALEGRTASTVAGAIGVQGLASDPATPNATFGVRGQSNSLSDQAAGVQAIGAGTAGAGLPLAAALEINNGAIRVTGPRKAANQVAFGPPWAAIISSSDPGPDLHFHKVGWSTTVDETNELITESSHILCTVEVDIAFQAQLRGATCHVDNKMDGSATFFVAALGAAGGDPPDVMGKVHYLIINP